VALTRRRTARDFTHGMGSRRSAEACVWNGHHYTAKNANDDAQPTTHTHTCHARGAGTCVWMPARRHNTARGSPPCRHGTTRSGMSRTTHHSGMRPSHQLDDVRLCNRGIRVPREANARSPVAIARRRRRTTDARYVTISTGSRCRSRRCGAHARQKQRNTAFEQTSTTQIHTHDVRVLRGQRTACVCRGQ
jgi:hypothetical protein